jgi:hypothetical protein
MWHLTFPRQWRCRYLCSEFKHRVDLSVDTNVFGGTHRLRLQGSSPEDRHWRYITLPLICFIAVLHSLLHWDKDRPLYNWLSGQVINGDVTCLIASPLFLVSCLFQPGSTFQLPCTYISFVFFLRRRICNSDWLGHCTFRISIGNALRWMSPPLHKYKQWEVIVACVNVDSRPTCFRSPDVRLYELKSWPVPPPVCWRDSVTREILQSCVFVRRCGLRRASIWGYFRLYRI